MATASAGPRFAAVSAPAYRIRLTWCRNVAYANSRLRRWTDELKAVQVVDEFLLAEASALVRTPQLSTRLVKTLIDDGASSTLQRWVKVIRLMVHCSPSSSTAKDPPPCGVALNPDQGAALRCRRVVGGIRGTTDQSRAWSTPSGGPRQRRSRACSTASSSACGENGLIRYRSACARAPASRSARAVRPVSMITVESQS